MINALIQTEIDLDTSNLKGDLSFDAFSTNFLITCALYEWHQTTSQNFNENVDYSIIFRQYYVAKIFYFNENQEANE